MSLFLEKLVHIMITIANIGLNSQTNILDNLIQIEQAIKTAKQFAQNNGQNLDLCVLPENAFCFGKQGFVSEYFDVLSAWCGELARHYDIHLLAGTLPCPYRPNGVAVADGKFRQSSLLFDPSGEQVARYDKIHLFKAIVNDTTKNYDEGLTFEAGNTPIVAKTAIGNIGMMICFDLRFAPLALRLRQLGAEILTAPSAFTFMTGKAHWQSLLTARALDSQCLVIGSAQGGTHFIKTSKGTSERQTWGNGEIVNAFGENIGKKLDLATLLAPTDNFHLNELLNNLPLCQKATAFLPPASLQNADEKYPDTAEIIMTNFDNHSQTQFREQIALMASQRFGISDPTRDAT